MAKRSRWPARQGTALVAVLLASAALLVVCFSLATVAILNLNLAGSYSMKSESLLIAEAAVSQLVAELERAQQEEVGSGAEVEPEKRLDLVERFSRPVFPSGAERFPGQVRITFDRHQDHFSVDNSYNETPAAAWLDLHTTRKSLPPFSIDLVMGVTIGSRTTWYQAVLRRRWPYVLCTPGRVTMMGAPTYQINGKTTTLAPSQITGNIYNLPNVDFCPSPSPGAPAPPPESDSPNIFVDASLIYNLLGVLPHASAPVSVGGTATQKVEIAPNVFGPPVQIVSTGNSLMGSVDMSTNDSDATISVYPGNTAVGSLRRNVKPYNLATNLQNAFRVPNLGDFNEVNLQAPPPGTKPSPPPTPAVPDPFASPGPGVDPTLPPPPPPPPPSPSPSPSEGPEPEPKPFFFLFHDVLLEGPSTKSFQFDPAARFKISMPAGNRYLQNGDEHNIHYTGAGIELHNCILYIQGNLDLSSTKPNPGQTLIMPALRGTNATIIVDGTLILNNGSLSASSEGMVIYCRRLVSATQGHYQGLIMVQKSAAICPAYPGAVIEIEGGVVCGGAPVALYALNPHPYPGMEDVPPTVSVVLNGFHLWSTHLTYDPKYLKTLNRFGPLNVLSMRQIE